MRLKEGIEQLMAKKNLEGSHCQHLISEFFMNDSDPIQQAAFLVLLRSKGETAEELSGMIAAFKESMITIRPKHKVLDIVGTGGDGKGTVNISTGSAILAASCGVKVAKHGNVAVTSLSGSADVLQALGVKIDSTPENILASIEDIGIGFCFSPDFHPAMNALRALRRQLNVRTSFNILGPLLNPTEPAHVVLGVFDHALLQVIAQTLQKIGTERSLVVHGNDIDELSCMGPVNIVEVTPTRLQEVVLDPQALGLARCDLSDLQGGSAQVNAQLLLDVFKGGRSQKSIAIGDTLILNAAVALYLYGSHNTIAEAVPFAREKLRDGSALTVVHHWIEYSHD